MAVYPADEIELITPSVCLQREPAPWAGPAALQLWGGDTALAPAPQSRSPSLWELLPPRELLPLLARNPGSSSWTHSFLLKGSLGVNVPGMPRELM